MFDARSLEKIAEVKTSGKVAPQTMCLKSPGILLVGLQNGNLEQFKFSLEFGMMEGIFPEANAVMGPATGVIYSMIVSKERHEIALATFSGLVFGRIDGNSDGSGQRWVTSKVYFKDKVISQLCQFNPGQFLVAEFSQPGYYVIDRHEIGATQPLKIQDTRVDHNSGCTDLQLIPMFD